MFDNIKRVLVDIGIIPPPASKANIEPRKDQEEEIQAISKNSCTMDLIHTAKESIRKSETNADVSNESKDVSEPLESHNNEILDLLNGLNDYTKDKLGSVSYTSKRIQEDTIKILGFCVKNAPEIKERFNKIDNKLDEIQQTINLFRWSIGILGGLMAVILILLVILLS